MATPEAETAAASLFSKPPRADVHRGIPEAIFIEDVSAMEKKLGTKDALAALQALLRRYRFWEQQISSARATLKRKLPETERSLDVIRFLRARAESGESVDNTLNFEMSDQLFVKARISPKVEKVGLWLGANVMVECTVEEAENLLGRNVENAKSTLAEHTEDLQYIRDQINVTEVNMTRTYNHDVMKTRSHK